MDVLRGVVGIQGETVRASYTGPGVDASGLYVGMTRGRHINTAITVARDLDDAVAHLADTMMRGRLEITLDDAHRASLGELGRAAREPADKGLRDALRIVREHLEAARAKERAGWARLRDMDAMLARVDAAIHARVLVSIGKRTPSAAERAAVAAQIVDARRDAAALTRQYRRLVATPDPGRDFRPTMLDAAGVVLEQQRQLEPLNIATQTSDPGGGLDL